MTKHSGRKADGKNTGWRRLAGQALFIVAGLGVGGFLGWYLPSLGIDYTGFIRNPLSAAALLVGFIATIYVQIIIHEAGHLAFGLLSGYRFVSFRIGSLMWLHDGSSLRLRRLSLAGTGGQCLMAPPDMTNGSFPYVLYNLGGVLMNVLSGLLFLGLRLVFPAAVLPALLLLMAAAVGFLFALLNGIPMRLGMVENDGHNLLSLAKNPEARRAFWLQLSINARLARGHRVRDLPEAWLTLPEDADMGNSLVAALAVIAAVRPMDEHRFKEADRMMAQLLSNPGAVPGLHLGLLKVDRIFMELLGENRPDHVTRLLDNSQQKFMKAMKGYISVLRTQYALALLHERDAKKATDILKRFEKAAKTYPNAGEVQAEREWVAVAAAKAKAGTRCAGQSHEIGKVAEHERRLD